MQLLDAVRARLRLLISRRASETRMDREFQFHIEMHTELLVREQGLSRDEARRRALAAFGGVEKHKEALRDGRSLAWLSGLSLDFRLGVRTLVKYPGITLVGGLALAIGIGLGAGYLEIVDDYLRPALPFEDAGRIVGLRNWDVAENDPEPRSLHDLLRWRRELRSVELLGAFRPVERNIGGAIEVPEPASGVEISPSAFAVVRVPAMLGRILVESDAREGAAEVVVLGHDLWRNRFEGDPAIVGRAVRVGASMRTVVGVMPDGFAFPVNHQFWMPLLIPTSVEPRTGAAVQVFGRLTPNVSRGEAQAELSALGARMTTELPATHLHLRPQVVRYTELFVGGEGSAEAYAVQILFVLLLLLLSSNVATMVFARTATREHEIAMRFALGSSQVRILGQFFVESLVLALAAAGVALAVVSWGSGWVTQLLWDVTEGRAPFWLDAGRGLSAKTILYSAAVAALAALVAGVLPAFKATRLRLQTTLRHAPGTGDTTLRFGGIWSALIVAQIAFAVMVLPPAIVAVHGLATADHAEPGFPAERYLSARVELEGDAETFERRIDELRHRLVASPAVSRVTFANRLPGMSHPEPGIQVDAAGAIAESRGLVMAAAVAPDYFDAFGAPMVAGRSFTPAETRSNAAVVVVNEDFVVEHFGGRNAVGRRLRYETRFGEHSTGARRSGGWYEIVGVVRNLGMDTTRDAFRSGTGPGVYHPLTPGAMGAAGTHAVRVAFHVRGDASAFAPRVREIARGIDPALRVYDVLPLDRPIDAPSRAQRRVGRFFAWVTALVALIAVLICVAGTYSVLSFTVARQTREIGIRIALGADSRRIVIGVFSRALVQIGAGIAIGTVIWFYVIVALLGGGSRFGVLAIAAALLMAVALGACAAPVRRALRIEPTEALRHAG